MDNTDASPSLRGIEYHDHFDADAYLREYYPSPEGNPDEVGLLPFWLQNLHEIFTQDGVAGDRLIDIGSGPCIHYLISACTRFSEIVCCEYVEDNRNAIRRWLNDDKGAYDWRPFVQYVCELEGHSDVEAREKRLRSVIKEVIPCDLNKADPIEPHSFPQFDCLLTCMTLKAACFTDDQWKQAVKNIAKYLKPGGTFVQLCQPGKFYTVGGKKFATYCADKELVRSAVTEAGFTDLKCRKHYKEDNLNECKFVEYDFGVLITAKKM